MRDRRGADLGNRVRLKRSSAPASRAEGRPPKWLRARRRSARAEGRGRHRPGPRHLPRRPWSASSPYRAHRALFRLQTHEAGRVSRRALAVVVVASLVADGVAAAVVRPGRAHPGAASVHPTPAPSSRRLRRQQSDRRRVQRESRCHRIRPRPCAQRRRSGSSLRWGGPDCESAPHARCTRLPRGARRTGVTARARAPVDPDRVSTDWRGPATPTCEQSAHTLPELDDQSRRP